MRGLWDNEGTVVIGMPLLWFAGDSLSCVVLGVLIFCSGDRRSRRQLIRLSGDFSLPLATILTIISAAYAGLRTPGPTTTTAVAEAHPT